MAPVINFMKYVGPGILVSVGFIDPGNLAINVSAGLLYGYKLLWVITLSTIMLIILQQNAARLGIATGYCLSEATAIYIKPFASEVHIDICGPYCNFDCYSRITWYSNSIKYAV